MKKNKGFTLIELLAVIAILAIILLIAVPMVLSTIASSKRASAQKSAQFAWEAAELHVANATIAGTTVGTSVAYNDYKDYLTGGSVTAGTFTVTTGAVAAAVDITVTSGGTTYTCNGASKAAIICTP